MPYVAAGGLGSNVDFRSARLGVFVRRLWPTFYCPTALPARVALHLDLC